MKAFTAWSIGYFAVLGAILVFLTIAPFLESPGVLFRENGPVEWLQVVVLMGAALLLYRTPVQVMGRFGALLILCAIIREMDAILDGIFDGLWEIGVGSALATAAALIWRAKHLVRTELRILCDLPGTLYLVISFAIVMIISRLLGQQRFWRAIMGEDHMRIVGRVVEESLELVGYVHLFWGALLIQFWKAGARDDRRNSAGAFPLVPVQDRNDTVLKKEQNVY